MTMIAKLNSRILALTACILLIAGFTGCKDMFVNPLVDKDTGDDVTLLLIDRNFIKTKFVVRLVDIATQEPIDQEEVEVRFVGDDANNLINFSGTKGTNYKTSSGFVEIGYDPNIVLSDQDPQVFTIIALSANYVSGPQVVEFTTDGVKNLTIRMIRTTFGKSANASIHGEPYDITFAGIKDNPNLGFNRNISSLSTGTAYEYVNLYMPTTAGNIVCDNLTDNVVYADFGVYILRWGAAGSIVPPATPSRNSNLIAGDFIYSSVKRTGLVRCNSGLTIGVSRADGKAGTGTFDYKITFADGATQTGSVTCTFPQDNLVEPIYYPSTNAAVKVEVFGDAQYNISAAVNLASSCGSRADFFATPKSNLNAIRFIVQYTCPNVPVGIALSIGGQFRKVGATGAWTDFEFEEGICTLQLEPLADYDMQVNIDGVFYFFTVPTDPIKVDAFINDQTSTEYTIKRLLIEPDEFGFTVTTDIEFGAGICDLLK